MQCKKCGAETGGDFNVCVKCGGKIKNTVIPIMLHETNPDGVVMIAAKRRFWLTSVLLIFRIVFGIIGALVYFCMPDLLIESNSRHNHATVFLSGFFCLIDALGIFLLLRWKKTGFWLSAASSIASAIIGIKAGYAARAIMYCVSGTLVLFGVLQIPKDGLSAWKKLEDGIFKKSSV
jgi:hypothetical protein